MITTDKIRMTSQLKSKSRVIINADDFGMTKGINKAIFELAERGTLTSASVMTNMPFFEDIIDLKDKIGIGFHVNLTTGKPINDKKRVPSLVDNNGDFLELSMLIKKIKNGLISIQEVEIELESQIMRLTSLGIQPDHINSHSSILKYPFLMKIAKKIAKKYEITAVRTFSPRKFDYKRLCNPKSMIISLYLPYQRFVWKKCGFRVADKKDSLLKFGLDYNTAIEMLKEVFSSLPAGVLEYAVHPGYCNGNNESLGKYIYERETELKALSSNEFKRIIEDSGTELISFKDI